MKRYFFCGYKIDEDMLMMGFVGDTRHVVKVKMCEGLHRSWKALKKRGYRVIKLRMMDAK